MNAVDHRAKTQLEKNRANLHASTLMIEIAEEKLIPIREVPRLLPLRPNGKRVHISACYRWIQRGVRGVRLEAMRIGGSMYTSVEALERFGCRLSDGLSATRPEPDSSARKGQLAQTSARLRSLLGSPKIEERTGDHGKSRQRRNAKAVEEP